MIVKRKVKNLLVKSVEWTLFHHRGDRTLNLNGLQLTFDASDAGGRQYNAKSSYEEAANPLYQAILDKFNPSLVIDVGANYGFTGLVCARNFPSAKIILVEPSARLLPYLRRNFEQNGFTNYEIVQAVCGEQAAGEVEFGIHPSNSQDNRVHRESSDWKTERVPTISLNALLERCPAQRFIFTKIDTQGYEQNVIQGAHPFITQNANWLIKMEFAPHWLRSQGTDPSSFLAELCAQFQVVEVPTRLRYKEDDLLESSSAQIHPADAPNFVSYIQSLDRNEHGWCDLLVSPRK